MQTFWADKDITYDGTQLTSLFAYRNFEVLGDSIISFCGPCLVNLSEMVDIEDVLDNAPIRGDRMLHFIVEHFGASLTLMVTRQRLLMAIIKDKLSVGGVEVIRNGDDLYFGAGKLSVSIATLSPVSGLIHTALNVTNNGTPIHTAALSDLGIDNAVDLASEIMTAYTAEINSIDRARCKVRGVK